MTDSIIYPPAPEDTLNEIHTRLTELERLLNSLNVHGKCGRNAMANGTIARTATHVAGKLEDVFSFGGYDEYYSDTASAQEVLNDWASEEMDKDDALAEVWSAPMPEAVRRAVISDVAYQCINYTSSGDALHDYGTDGLVFDAIIHTCCSYYTVFDYETRKYNTYIECIYTDLEPDVYAYVLKMCLDMITSAEDATQTPVRIAAQLVESLSAMPKTYFNIDKLEPVKDDYYDKLCSA